MVIEMTTTRWTSVLQKYLQMGNMDFVEFLQQR